MFKDFVRIPYIFTVWVSYFDVFICSGQHLRVCLNTNFIKLYPSHLSTHFCSENRPAVCADASSTVCSDKGSAVCSSNKTAVWTDSRTVLLSDLVPPNWSEGFPRAGHLIPGYGGTRAWQISRIVQALARAFFGGCLRFSIFYEGVCICSRIWRGFHMFSQLWCVIFILLFCWSGQHVCVCVFKHPFY